MSDSEFIELYVRIIRVTERYQGDPEQCGKARKKIFEESGYTREEFESFAKRYREKPEKWQDMWERIVNKAKER